MKRSKETGAYYGTFLKDVMKRKPGVLSILVLALLVFSLVSLDVMAHPGRTDSKGGHTNCSTGEYHYHHGYSEHDHYDMDGDGSVDCPYDFEAKTERKSSSNPASSEPAIKEKTKTTNIWLAILALGLYVFFMFILPFLI